MTVFRLYNTPSDELVGCYSIKYYDREKKKEVNRG